MKASWRWPAAVIGLIGGNMLLVAVTVYFATSDPSAAVESNYYQKAVEWDRQARQRAESEKLGWTMTVTRRDGDQVEFALRDREGGPVTGAVLGGLAFAEARAGKRLPVAASEAEPGRYVASVGFTRGGLWRFDVEARRGAERFIASVQIELPLDDPPSAGAGVRE
jgi:nitrogen fixation protein FixH